MIRAVNGVFERFRNSGRKCDDIPLTIIERPTTAQTIVEEDLDVSSEDKEDEPEEPLIPIQPVKAVPTAPEKIG